MDASCVTLMTTTCLKCWLRPSPASATSKFARPAAKGSRKSSRNSVAEVEAAVAPPPDVVPQEERDIKPHRRDHPYSVSFSGHVPPEAFCPMGAFGWRGDGRPPAPSEWKVAPPNAPIVIAGANDEVVAASPRASSSARGRGGRKDCRKRKGAGGTAPPQNAKRARREAAGSVARASPRVAAHVGSGDADAAAVAAVTSAEDGAARHAAHWWDINEEFMLLDAIEQHGLGNWKAAAEQVSCCALRAGLSSATVARVEAAALALRRGGAAAAAAAAAASAAARESDAPTYSANNIAWQRR